MLPGIILAGALTAAAADTTPFDFTLVRDGTAAAPVIVAGTDPALDGALSDLKEYVHRITGADLTIHTGVADLPGPTLHIGRTAHFAATAEARAAIKGDGFVVATIGEDCIIAGNLPQGTANGITTILQDQFGVRWYYAGPLWEVVPHKPSLLIELTPNAAGAAYVENPSFYGRHLWGRPPTERFGRRMRLTRKDTPLPYVGTGHALNHVVPLDTYARDHPDYFAFMKGRRITDRVSQPCFTHPDMADVFMTAVRKTAAAGGRTTSFGVNDNLDACRCPRCLAIDGDAEPYMGMVNVSESYCQLLARVAARTAREFPGMRLGIFAYQQTNAPPKTVDVIGKNVDVVLCQDTSQHFDPAVQAMDHRMSSEWVKTVGGVSFYGYVGINYWTPRYFPHILAAQVKHLAEIGVLGFQTHGTTMPDSSMPMFYLLYRLLWDADLDPDAVISTMLNDCYGTAAEHMRDFYEHWERQWMRQTTAKWFKGMDDLRAEFTIYSLAAIERGQAILDRALAAASTEPVKQRVAFVRSSFAYTVAAARAHFAYRRAIVSTPPTPEAARRLSTEVVESWEAFARTLKHAERLPGSSASGWHSKTFRVRAWAFKQEMREGVMAPLVRWVCAKEGTGAPERLRAVERDFARIALAHRARVEAQLTEGVGAAARPPCANALIVSDIPHARIVRSKTGGIEEATPISGVPWIFRGPPPPPAKYDEPMRAAYREPPQRRDHAVSWQAAWDETRLYLRIVVLDDRHRQDQNPPQMHKEDSVQIALSPHRHEYRGASHSWYFLMGGYHGDETAFGVSLRAGRAQTHVWRAPPTLGSTDPLRLIEADAARAGARTLYDIAVSWKLLPGFTPAPERSFGIAIVVNDVDDGPRCSAEYGGGVAGYKRPAEFTALRLVAQP